MFHFLSKLFQNPGKKLKTVSLILFLLIALGGIAAGLSLFGVFSSRQIEDYGIYIILALIIGSVPVAWLTTLPLFGFAELIEKATSIDRKLDGTPSSPSENRSAGGKAPDSAAKRIADLKQLLDRGILTPEEYEQKKRELMGNSQSTNS